MSTVLNLTGRRNSLEAQARAQNSSQLFLKTSFSLIHYKVHICVHTCCVMLSTSWSLLSLSFSLLQMQPTQHQPPHRLQTEGGKCLILNLETEKILCLLPLYFISLNPADFCILQWDARSFKAYVTSFAQICLKIDEVKMKVFQSVGFRWWSIPIVRSGLYIIGPF
jgi:hypothetical protein